MTTNPEEKQKPPLTQSPPDPAEAQQPDTSRDEKNGELDSLLDVLEDPELASIRDLLNTC